MYNTILRRFPADDFKFFDDNQHLFTATIFVLVSAIQKLARVTQNPPNLLLYRGLGGTAALPESFSVRDSLGCTGFTEWGVMSATSQRDVAISYSGIEEKKPVPIVLEIRVGAVDRGASIQNFSQYPQEKEFVFVPCSFLEQDGFHEQACPAATRRHTDKGLKVDARKHRISWTFQSLTPLYETIETLCNVSNLIMGRHYAGRA